MQFLEEQLNNEANEAVLNIFLKTQMLWCSAICWNKVHSQRDSVHWSDFSTFKNKDTPPLVTKRSGWWCVIRARIQCEHSLAARGHCALLSLALCRGVELVTPTTLPRLSHQGFSPSRGTCFTHQHNPSWGKAWVAKRDHEIRIVFSPLQRLPCQTRASHNLERFFWLREVWQA